MGTTANPDKDSTRKPGDLYEMEIQDSVEFAPSDRYNGAFLLMILLGMGCIYPWSFFMTAADYYSNSFRNITNEDSPTIYNYVFQSTLTMIAASCGVLGMFLNSSLTRLVSVKWRIYIGMAFVTIIFVATTVLTTVETDSWQGGFFAVTMVFVFFINLASNVYAGGIHGIQGCLPVHYTTALTCGQGLSGVFAAIASILSIVATSGNENESTINATIKQQAGGYFGSAIGAMVLCFIGFTVFLRLPVVRYYLDPESTMQSTVVVTTVNQTKFIQHSSIKTILYQMAPYLLIILLSYSASLCVFPAIAVQVKSAVENPKDSILTDKLFTPLNCFLAYNLGDFSGRLAHGFIQYPRPSQWKVSMVLAVLRIVLLPLIFFCNAAPSTRRTEVLFGDEVFVTLILLLGISNGYMANLGVMYGPKRVAPHDAEVAGGLIGLFINIGLTLGAAISFGLVFLL